MFAVASPGLVSWIRFGRLSDIRNCREYGVSSNYLIVLRNYVVWPYDHLRVHEAFAQHPPEHNGDRQSLASVLSQALYLIQAICCLQS